jgi:hypothetical protein
MQGYDVEEGARGAIVAILGLFVLPVILIVLAIDLLGYRTLPQAIEVSIALQQMMPWIALFGGSAAALVFLTNSMSPHSETRLAFGIAFVAVEILLLYSVLLLTGLPSALAANGVSLPFDIIFVLGAVLLGFRVTRPLGDYLEGRRSVPLGPARDDSVREDFRTSHGTFSKGVNSAQAALALFVVVPVIVLIFIDAMIKANLLGGVELPMSIDQYLIIMLGLGIPAAWCAFFIGFYPLGSISRAIFGIATAGIGSMWLICLTSGGRLTVDHSMGLMWINYAGLVILVVLATLAWCAYFALQMLHSRRDYLRGGRRTPNQDIQKTMRDLERAKERAAKRKKQ